MKAITTRGFAPPEPEVQPIAWMELACKLLEAEAAHAVRWNQAEYDAFREEMEESLAALKTQPASSVVLISAGTLPQKIERYHQETQRAVDGSLAELREITRILMSSVDAVQTECDQSASALHQAQETIIKTNNVEELRVTKLQLSFVLRKLAEKQRERKQKAAELLGNLQERVQILEQSFAPGALRLSAAGAPAESSADAADEPLDSLTGLPGREAAEQAIRVLQANPGGGYLAAFYVQRISQFQARFGDRITDELLLLCAQRIAKAVLRPGDRMFRWRGPVFAALLARQEPLIEVKKVVQRFIGSRLQFELRSGEMIASAIIAGEAFPGGKDLVQQLEKFLSLPSTRGT